MTTHLQSTFCFVYGIKFFILSQQVQRKVMHIKHFREKDQKRAIPTFSKVFNDFSYFTPYIYKPSVQTITSIIIPNSAMITAEYKIFKNILTKFPD